MAERVVYIDYTNHRGERRWRSIRPRIMRFRETEWHGEAWVLEAWDLEKPAEHGDYGPGARRTFALKNIHEWLEDADVTTWWCSTCGMAVLAEERTHVSTNRDDPGGVHAADVPGRDD